MMLITTSRKPGQLTRAIARTLASALGAAYLNRGKGGMDAVLEEAEKAGASKILFVWERYGNPSRLVGFDMEKARALEQEGLEEKDAEAQDGEGQDAEGKRPEIRQDLDVPDPRKTPFTLSQKKKAARQDREALQDPDSHDEDETDGRMRQNDSTPWLRPEISIRGAVFNRIPIRHKGAQIKFQDPFGEKAAGLLDAQEGPNQIVLSRAGLKIMTGDALILELKFRT